MKRYLALFLTVVLILSQASCGSTARKESNTPTSQTTAPATVETQPKTEVPKSLKILAIGNSYSVDTTTHLFKVAKAEGIEEIIIGNMFVGSCTLAMHLDNAETNTPAYVYYKNTQDNWILTQNTTLEYALQDEHWDIIVMQQASKDSGMQDTYEPALSKLIDYVKDTAVKKDFKLYWNMTWAYQGDYKNQSFTEYGNNQMAMYNAITEAVQKRIVKNDAFEAVIPVGTVIQNARTSIGDTLTRDGTHLSEFGRLLSAYTWFCTFTNQRLQDVQMKNFANKALTKNEKELIVKAVNGALEKPFEITKLW